MTTPHPTVDPVPTFCNKCGFTGSVVPDRHGMLRHTHGKRPELGECPYLGRRIRKLTEAERAEFLEKHPWAAGKEEERG